MNRDLACDKVIKEWYYKKHLLHCMACCALYPAGVLLCGCFRYSFELISVAAFAVMLAALSIGAVAFSLISAETSQNTMLRILMAVLALLSMVNGVLYMFESGEIIVIACMFISAGCAFYLTMKLGKPKALKIVALVISALLLLPIGFLAFIMTIFGNIGQDTIVKTLESPNGQYYAQVIDSDQGALGGDTLVKVYEHKGLDLFLIRIQKKPHLIYFGEWGEFKNMEIHWNGDSCLVINSVEYTIEN